MTTEVLAALMAEAGVGSPSRTAGDWTAEEREAAAVAVCECYFAADPDIPVADVMAGDWGDDARRIANAVLDAVRPVVPVVTMTREEADRATKPTEPTITVSEHERPIKEARAVPEGWKRYGPYRVKWMGPAIWAGITDELPPELEGKDVYVVPALNTSPEAPSHE